MEITLDDLIDKEAVKKMYGGITDSTLYKRMSEKHIPRPISWPPNTKNKRWIRQEIENKIADDLKRAQQERDEQAA